MIASITRVARRLWGAHAPRVLFAAPRREHGLRLAARTPCRPAKRRTKDARRVRSAEFLPTLPLLMLSCAILLLFPGCRQDMYNQPKAKTYSATEFFDNGTSAQPIPPHTVEYHGVRQNEAFFTGLTNGVLVAQLPMRVTPALLERGRERYNIYCAVCHGISGEGNGEIVQRGFPAPPTYHSERLRNAPIGHFYDVITNGYGVMYPYASRVEPADRWAIAAYIRALQLSQDVKESELLPNEQRQLERTP
jgi:mono/diheme cytochrome c family protein